MVEEYAVGSSFWWKTTLAWIIEHSRTNLEGLQITRIAICDQTNNAAVYSKYAAPSAPAAICHAVYIPRPDGTMFVSSKHLDSICVSLYTSVSVFFCIILYA